MLVIYKEILEDTFYIMKKILLIFLCGLFFSSFVLANEEGEWALSGFVCSADQQKFRIVHFPERNPLIDATWSFNSDGTISSSAAKKNCITKLTGVYTANGSTVRYTVRSETKQGTDCSKDDNTGKSISFEFVINEDFLYRKLARDADGREEACGNDNMYQAFIKQ